MNELSAKKQEIAERRGAVARLTRCGWSLRETSSHLHVDERTVVRDRAALGVRVRQRRAS